MNRPFKKSRAERYAEQPKNIPRVSARQVLEGSENRPSQFFAIIIDPDTQRQLKRVLIYEAEPGEVVEMALGRFTVMDDGANIEVD